MEVVGPCVSGGYAATAITASSSSASGLVSSSAAETASSSDSVMVSAPRQRAGGVADESGQLVAGHRGDDLFGDKRGPDAHIGVPLAVTARPVLVAGDLDDAELLGVLVYAAGVLALVPRLGLQQHPDPGLGLVSGSHDALRPRLLTGMLNSLLTVRWRVPSSSVQPGSAGSSATRKLAPWLDCMPWPDQCLPPGILNTMWVLVSCQITIGWLPLLNSTPGKIAVPSS